MNVYLKIMMVIKKSVIILNQNDMYGYAKQIYLPYSS